MPDLNTTCNIQIDIHEDAFKEFVRRGKELLFDQYFELLKLNLDEDKVSLDLIMNFDASTEDKLELVIKNNVSENELDNYLKQCWKYDFVEKLEADGFDPTQFEMMDITVSMETKYIPFIFTMSS